VIQIASFQMWWSKVRQIQTFLVLGPIKVKCSEVFQTYRETSVCREKVSKVKHIVLLML
jgi:hypothetical protein